MVVAVLVGGILVAGCSTDSRRQAGADESNVTEHVGELRIGIVEPMSADPATVNPTHAIDVLAADLLYDGLTSYDAVSGLAVPELAESWDTADGITWTFHLAERTFSDGSPVTAAAVVASLERVRAMTSTSLAAGRLDVVAAVDECVAPSRLLGAAGAQPARDARAQRAALGGVGGHQHVHVVGGDQSGIAQVEHLLGTVLAGDRGIRHPGGQTHQIGVEPSWPSPRRSNPRPRRRT